MILGVIALFALCFVLEGLRTLDKGSFAFDTPVGRRLRIRNTIGAPHAERIAAGCFALAAAIVLWGVVLVNPSTRTTPGRRAVVAAGSGLLLGTAVLCWLPPWRLWPHSPLLAAYAVPAVAAVLWRATRIRDPIVQRTWRIRMSAALAAVAAGLSIFLGLALLGGALVGALLVVLWAAHRRFQASSGRLGWD